MEKIFNFFVIIAALIAFSAAESQQAICKTGTECVPLYECDEILSMTDQEKLNFKKLWCGTSGKTLFYCCRKKKLPQPGTCGWPTRSLLFGGEYVLIEEFTWVAQIFYSKPGNSSDIHCEGSLINERYVLTAASCVQKVPESWKISKVRLGDWRLSTNPDCDLDGYCNAPYLEIPVEKIIVHEGYDHASKNQHNDIALLKLEEEVYYTNWINPICLPTDANLKLNRAYLSFYGFLTPELNREEKLQLYITIMSTEKCQEFYSGQNITILDTQICGEVSNNKCHSYNGGALTNIEIKGSDYYTVVGIPSFKPQYCKDEKVPAVYTHVSSYLDWIEKNID